MTEFKLLNYVLNIACKRHIILVAIICLITESLSYKFQIPRFSSSTFNDISKSTLTRMSTNSKPMKLYSSNMRERDTRPLNDTPLELCDENVAIVLDEVRQELGTLFGYDPGFIIYLYLLHHGLD